MTFFELLCSCSLLFGAGGGACAGLSWGFLGVVVGLVLGGALGVGTYIAVMAIAAGIESVAGAGKPGARPFIGNAAALLVFAAAWISPILALFAAYFAVAPTFGIVGALFWRP